MANVIIGHTTDRTARIWLRGGWRHARARVSLRNAGGEVQRQDVQLSRRRDFTGFVDFSDLHPDTPYTVQADFSWGLWRWGRVLPIERAPLGRFRTAPLVAGQLTFLFGSCNLTNIKVNNMLGLIAGVTGSYVLGEALRRDCEPPDRDVFLLRWIKGALKLVVNWVAGGIYMATNYRQPGPPWVVSPFLRLATLFDTWQLTTIKGGSRPGLGTVVTGEKSSAAGIVAFAAEPAPKPDEPPASKRKPSGDEAEEEQRLVLVPMNQNRFIDHERLIWGDKDEPTSATIKKIDERKPPTRPQLMLHLGDQIYFDFPRRDHRPTLKNYRRAYREAWCEDVVAAHFLAQCPQYMTLDDHEIFNNFATDAIAPRPALGAAAYAVPALAGYDEYVHVRHPGHPLPQGAKCGECGRPLGGGRPLYYSFSHGDLAHFFVMDTRTERYSGGLIGEPGRMVSCCQLETLKLWLTEHKDDLAFVVSSVPFVPEVHSTADEVPNTKGNKTSIDKWCAPAFAAQREAIVRHICDVDARRVVFLTGDMHCCYHALMRIRPASKPARCVTIHELAAGPIYQLRLSRSEHFFEVFRGAYGGHNKQRLPYVSRVQHFYSLANAVMAVTVADGGPTGSEILWDIIPTVGQPHPANRDRRDVTGLIRTKPRPDKSQKESPAALLDPAEPVMRGKICFAR